MLAHGSHEIDSGEAGDPGNREAILAAMELDVQRLLASQSPMEELTENRFLSLERYIAFLVSPPPPGSLGERHETSWLRELGVDAGTRSLVVLLQEHRLNLDGWDQEQAPLSELSKEPRRQTKWCTKLCGWPPS
jgi:hypothetical protein